MKTLYLRIILSGVVSDVHLRGFVPRPTPQVRSGGESLATCVIFNRLVV